MSVISILFMQHVELLFSPYALLLDYCEYIGNIWTQIVLSSSLRKYESLAIAQD